MDGGAGSLPGLGYERMGPHAPTEQGARDSVGLTNEEQDPGDPRPLLRTREYRISGNIDSDKKD